MVTIIKETNECGKKWYWPAYEQSRNLHRKSEENHEKTSVRQIGLLI
jgi:hypothetical protein